jgi:superoxide dismutase
MTLHHKKHHQTYVTGLNAAEESYAKSSSVEEKIRLQAAIKFNGGGRRIGRNEWTTNDRHAAQATLTTRCSGRTSHPPRTTAGSSRAAR